MKKICSRLFIIVISLTIITVFLVPFLILAENGKKGEKEKTFCEYIEDVSSKVGQRITDRDAELAHKRFQTVDKINERRDRRDIKFQEKHIKWDTNRSEHFAALEEKTGTDEEKQALINLKKIISDAIIARREAVNLVIQEFRDAMDTLKTSRKTSSDQAISTYQNEIKEAFAKAKTDCADDVDPKIIRENLRNDSKEAQKSFVNNKKKVDGNKDEIEVFITVKKEATKQVIDNFKEIIQNALADFRESFPEDEEQ